MAKHLDQGVIARAEFMACVAACAKNNEYVENWLRLRGYSLPRSAIERMVDEASGHGDAIAQQFIADVHETVYSRLDWNRRPADVEADRNG